MRHVVGSVATTKIILQCQKKSPSYAEANEAETMTCVTTHRMRSVTRSTSGRSVQFSSYAVNNSLRCLL